MAEKEKTYPVYKVGDKHEDILTFKQYLVGMYRGRWKSGIESKDIDLDKIDINSNEYDPEMEKLVIHYQSSLDIKEDGIIGEETLKGFDYTDKGLQLKDGWITRPRDPEWDIPYKPKPFPSLRPDGQPPIQLGDMPKSIKPNPLEEFKIEKSNIPDISFDASNNAQEDINQLAGISNEKPTYSTLLPNYGKIPPTATTTTPKGSTGKGLWDGLSLGQYEKLVGKKQGGFYQPLLPDGYSVSAAAKEKLNAEQQEGSQNKNDLMSYLMNKLGENLKNNKQDVITDRAFNDTISIGEMMNNLNEPPYEDVSKIEAGKMQAVKMSNDTMIDNIDRQKNSQIKYMRSIGRQDLIPSIVAATDNKKAEMSEQLNNTNANLENAARQTNLQTETQTKAANTGIDQFNRQMFERAEINKGAAVSQNLTNIRNSSRDFTNNMTGVRDNDLSYLMYMAASEDPKLKDALSNYMYQQSRRKNKRNQYIYNAQGVDQNGNSIAQ